MNYFSIEDCFSLIGRYGISDKDLFQGGVYTGNTLLRLIEGAESVNKPFRRIFAADCFIGGLPKETDGLYQNPDWPEHAFDVSKDYGLKTIQEAMQFVHSRVNKDNVVYIPGYFSESLNKELADFIGEKNISFLDVDVDIHSSSLELLDFVFQYNILCDAAIIRFDDYNSTPDNAGQRLAWSQIVSKYKVWSVQCSDNVFQVAR